MPRTSLGDDPPGLDTKHPGSRLDGSNGPVLKISWKPA